MIILFLIDFTKQCNLLIATSHKIIILYIDLILDYDNRIYNIALKDDI